MATLVITIPALAQEITVHGENIYTGPIPNNRRIIPQETFVQGENVYTGPIPNNRNKKTTIPQVSGTDQNTNTNPPQSGNVQHRRR